MRTLYTKQFRIYNTNMTGIIRNLEKKIDKLLNLFPVVIVIGARQTGKTTISKTVRPSWKYFDLENGNDYNRITDDFEMFFSQNERNIIIDEAQESPQLFKELRGIIDKKRHIKNRFLITGSSSFELQNNVNESLAGRAAIVELGTLKVNEISCTPLPEFYNIFSDDINDDSFSYLKKLRSNIDIDDFNTLFLKGGYPEPLISDNKEFFEYWMENYIQTYINRDIRKLFPNLDHIKYRKMIMMLTSLSGSIINRSELGRSLDINEKTVKNYIDIAHGSFIFRNIPSYENSTAKSVIKSPKGSIRDSGIINYLNKIDTLEKIESYPRVGINFEAFVIEEILKGLEASFITNWNYYYYRTRNGSEIDLILEGKFGVVPIEIKYGMNTRIKQLTGLNKFLEDNSLPLGIVVNNSDEIRMISNKIIQIPVTYI